MLYLCFITKRPLICQDVENIYSKKRAEAGPYFDATFTNNEVSFDIPKNGLHLSSGWSIKSLIYPPKVRM